MPEISTGTFLSSNQKGKTMIPKKNQDIKNWPTQTTAPFFKSSAFKFSLLFLALVASTSDFFR